jgi:hypothetical protein
MALFHAKHDLPYSLFFFKFLVFQVANIENFPEEKENMAEKCL